jgi:hypothetical protein
MKIAVQLSCTPQSIQDALAKLPSKTRQRIEENVERLNRGIDNEILRQIIHKANPELSHPYGLAFLRSMLWRMEQDAWHAKIKEPAYRRSINVGILWSMMSGESFYTYEKNPRAQKFMGVVTREIIDPLWKSRLIKVVPHNRKLHRCRVFDLKSLAKAVHNPEPKSHMHPFDINYDDGYQLPPVGVGQKRLPLSWSKEKGKYMDITNATGEYLRNCKFRFEHLAWERIGLYWAKKFANIAASSEESRDAIYGSIKNAVEGLDWRMGVQYMGQYRLQGPGRMHTIGGSIAMPKPFRRLFISPVDRNNLVLELDLKSAQLVILSKHLNCQEILKAIRDCNATGNSIWNLIRPEGTDIPKRALKVLTYGLCFGARREDLLFLCNKELRKTDSKFKFNEKSLDAVLNGFLAPLLRERDAELAKYTSTLLKKKGTKLRHKNALGLVFDAGKELKAYEKKCAEHGKDPVETKIAGRILAHYAQGAEQFIMQSFISSNAMQENILDFSYDGLSIEVPEEHTHITDRYDAWLQAFDPDHHFEYCVLWFKRNSEVKGPNMMMDMLREDWEEKYNQKPENLQYFPD